MTADPSVSLYGQRFSIYLYCTFYDFLIDANIKISRCHKIAKTLPIAKKSNSRGSHYSSSADTESSSVKN